ncbi:nitrate reductase delta subunit [Gordonia araii NBRC 100433]|uniref:Nitrate reductase delta subunit n=1 Tax=Gordonia araii NBRC 100433 TaxID=1073574 RepID=G7GYL6_9ACTN|nr:nitrate reductase molybdenum cofactor assembly chaperone [Gordonia araii]NNG97449.1 nitrate reductase molybdenum cofactor assembly chaperone [Gordonia araii NBRC 100433]GAB08691.1 nitrate reductase delta subunit [Gordonia araii NBRC 100433]
MRNLFAATAARTRRLVAEADDRVAYQVASWCLQYPDDEVLGRAELLRAALAEQPPSAAVTALTRFVDRIAASDPTASRREYVDVFDLSRRQTLYLTYWSHGDTRRRGSALAQIKRRYRDAGFLVDTRGELTDYLPIMLEFAARVDPRSGRELLIENRAGLELIRLALIEQDSPYAEVLAAVCATLPGESPADKASALALRGAPETVEQVGLEAGDPRLMPLFTTAEMAAPSPAGRSRR